MIQYAHAHSCCIMYSFPVQSTAYCTIIFHPAMVTMDYVGPKSCRLPVTICVHFCTEHNAKECMIDHECLCTYGLQLRMRCCHVPLHVLYVTAIKVHCMHAQRLSWNQLNEACRSARASLFSCKLLQLSAKNMACGFNIC